MYKLRITICVALFTLLASFAEAHPSHGTTEPSSLLHVLSEPEHVLFAFVVIAAMVVSFATLVRRSGGA